MSYSAVIISLCALIALAHGTHLGNVLRNRVVKTTLQQMHQQINVSLAHIYNQREILPDSSCASFGMEELERAKQNLTAVNLAKFRCHMMKMASSNLTPDLSYNLTQISQHSQDAENWLGSREVTQNCTQPTFARDGDCYIYVKCLLEFLDELITNAKF